MKWKIDLLTKPSPMLIEVKHAPIDNEKNYEQEPDWN
jgi:hypothetical protein